MADYSDAYKSYPKSYSSEESKERWVTKDSGERAQFESGMQRDTEAGKARFDLLVPDDVPYEEQMMTRFAMLLSRGAEKYTERNWEKANSKKELNRYKSSAYRHFFQWISGETDEDHAAAVMFNLMCYETIKYKMERPETLDIEVDGKVVHTSLIDKVVDTRGPCRYTGQHDKVCFQQGDICPEPGCGWGL